MKKTLLVFIVAILSLHIFVQTKNTIAVPAPKTINIGAGNEWIPLFIQGVITSNFQQYSGMKVIDRQNSDMVKAEQRLSESAEFDEKNTIEIGKMTNAHLIVTGSITGKSNSYALIFSITDAETGETKASANLPNCLFSVLENGEAANQISYDLMSGYGINLSDDAKKKLTQKASVMSAENNAQTSVAKGIVAEQSGSNIEALTYYIQAKKNDKKLSEATSRMANMTTVVKTGNFGANAKNMIKMRDDWDKLLYEAASFIASNGPTFTLKYFSDIEPMELTTENYDKGTMSFTVSSPFLIQNDDGYENQKIVDDLLYSLHKIPESKNWGDKINGFPWSYGHDFAGNNWLKKAENFKRLHSNNQAVLLGYNFIDEFKFEVTLLDSKKMEIAKKQISFYVPYVNKFAGFRIFSNNGSNNMNGFYNSISIYNDNSSLEFNNVSVNDADTENLYLMVTQLLANDVSIVPVHDDVLSCEKAISAIQQGAKKIKIGGIVDFDELESAIRNNHIKELDLSEMANTSIPFPTRISGDHYLYYSWFYFKTLTISSRVTAIAYGVFGPNIELKNINYYGTEAQWNKLYREFKEQIKYESHYPSRYKIRGIKVNCNYDPNGK